MAEIFIKEYPEKKAEIKRFLGWIESPPSDKDTVINFLDTFGA